jgi:hypothetical protein
MLPSQGGCVAGSDVPPQDVGGEVGVLLTFRENVSPNRTESAWSGGMDTTGRS